MSSCCDEEGLSCIQVNGRDRGPWPPTFQSSVSCCHGIPAMQPGSHPCPISFYPPRVGPPPTPTPTVSYLHRTTLLHASKTSQFLSYFAQRQVHTYCYRPGGSEWIVPDLMTVILKSFPAPTPFPPTPPCRPSRFLTSTGFPQRLENLENESGHFTEKSWNIIDWPKVMEFCECSWSFTNFAPELYQICIFCHC